MKKHLVISLPMALWVLGAAAPWLAKAQEPVPVLQPQGAPVTSTHEAVSEGSGARPQKKRWDLEKARSKSPVFSKKKKHFKRTKTSSTTGTEGFQMEVTGQTEVSHQADKKK